MKLTHLTLALVGSAAFLAFTPAKAQIIITEVDASGSASNNNGFNNGYKEIPSDIDPNPYLSPTWSINADITNFTHLAEFAARLPTNAAFLVDEHQRLENKLVEFATDREKKKATEKV